MSNTDFPLTLLQPDRELTKEVLELAEFGLKSLENYNRFEAMSSVGLQY